MLTMLRKRLHNDDKGFTLIELMVVVLIIAILIAIAIPTFLGAQKRAQDRSAQSNLRNGITAAKTIATDSAGKFLNSGGTVILAADLIAAEPAIGFVDTAVSTVGPVYVTTATAGASILLYNRSASDKYFCIYTTSAGAVTYGSTTAAAPVLADCSTATKW